MACMVCEDDHGMCYCENDCTYLICDECKSKLEECPQCKCGLRINMFFAGKICEPEGERSNAPCTLTRRYVVNPASSRYELNDLLNYLTSEGGMELHPENIIKYEHYINLQEDIGVQAVNNTLNVTGPCAILDMKVMDRKNLSVCHGTWDESDIELLFGKDLTKISDIVNKRNYEMIEKCHVFSLRLNDDFDCYRSIAEWGIASSLGKTLILEPMINPYKALKKNGANEFYLFACESIKTLEKLSFPRRNAIFKVHPRINMSYKEYKEYMHQLIEFKSSHKGSNLISDDISISTHVG